MLAQISRTQSTRQVPTGRFLAAVLAIAILPVALAGLGKPVPVLKGSEQSRLNFDKLPFQFEPNAGDG